jgi:hypothetical protein
MKTISAIALSLCVSAQAQVIFNSDFEDQTLSCWNTKSGGQANCSPWTYIHHAPITLTQGEIYHTGNCATGTKSVKISYDSNETEGAAQYVFAGADTIYNRYWIYFDAGFDFAQGMKIGRVRGINGGGGTDFDIILTTNSGAPAIQCGQNDNVNIYLAKNGTEFAGGPLSAPFNFTRQTWHCVEYKIALNTPYTSSNGSIAISVNGSQIASRSSMQIRTTATKANNIWEGGWYSNGVSGTPAGCSHPSQNSRLYIDDVVISKAPIGCN